MEIQFCRFSPLSREADGEENRVWPAMIEKRTQPVNQSIRLRLLGNFAKKDTGRIKIVYRYVIKIKFALIY